MKNVFMSYSHVDAEFADELSSMLTDLKVGHFRDVKDISWGKSITSEVRKGLAECTAILVIVSPASLKSHWVHYEIGHSSALQKIILPFLTHPSIDAPLYIKDLNYVTSIEQARDYFTSSFPGEADRVESSAKMPKKGPLLTEMQVEYLLEISKPRNNGVIFGIDERAGRVEAPYQEAIALFQELGLMSNSDGVYKFTHHGWQYSDRLWVARILDALDLRKSTSDEDLAKAVGLTDGQTEIDELKRLIDAPETNGLVIINRTQHGWSIRISEKGLTQRKHQELVVPTLL